MIYLLATCGCCWICWWVWDSKHYIPIGWVVAAVFSLDLFIHSVFGGV